MNEIDKLERTNREQHSKLFDALKELSIQIATIPKDILDEADERYAPMWAAKMWVFVIAGIGTGLIAGFMGYILLDRVQALF